MENKSNEVEPAFRQNRNYMLSPGKILILTKDDKLFLIDTFKSFLDLELTPDQKAVYN